MVSIYKGHVEPPFWKGSDISVDRRYPGTESGFNDLPFSDTDGIFRNVHGIDVPVGTRVFEGLRHDDGRNAVIRADLRDSCRFEKKDPSIKECIVFQQAAHTRIEACYSFRIEHF
jgi:hypothetical protein